MNLSVREYAIWQNTLFRLGAVYILEQADGREHEVESPHLVENVLSELPIHKTVLGKHFQTELFYFKYLMANDSVMSG